jgi:glutathione synthase/RimK-type ligase-like ATP-grasp enzyme
VRLIVVERPERWPFQIPGVEVVAAREYLTSEKWARLSRVSVLNFCRSYGKNTTGYYVSLLALARGHRPLPSVTTLQGLHVDSVVRLVSDDLHERIQSSLRPLKSARFDLSVYFGRNLARRYEALSRELFRHFPVPFLRARFERGADGAWVLAGIRAVPASDVPDEHAPFVIESAERFFRRSSTAGARRRDARYDLAILWSEGDPQAPSNAGAIRKFVRAAERAGIRAETIEPNDFALLELYDALFVRETTQVGHHTHRFALRAEAAGLVVIDDPESIVRCTNKVYQTELFARHAIPTPTTMVVHSGNRDEVSTRVGLPCVLKDPAGSFSVGTVKAQTEDELGSLLDGLLQESELVIAQAWTPTSFDWRVGVLGGVPLFASRYHMARGHWQIVQADAGGSPRFGRVEAVPLEAVPAEVLRVATAAAGLIGDGLYGVDLKELVDGRIVVTEVNDNPNIDAGCEDGVSGEALYDAIMQHFVALLDARGRAP